MNGTGTNGRSRAQDLLLLVTGSWDPSVNQGMQRKAEMAMAAVRVGVCEEML